MNRKNLTAAVLAGLAGAAGIVGTASASHGMFLNPDGLGQVLIYPYYTANAGNATLMSVVNTTAHAKAVKVRFKEGENSREVLDFNLYLSQYDVWTAAVINDGGTPTLIIPDNTCTVPYLYLNDSDGDGAGEQAFLDFDYTGDNADGGSSDIGRAMEGHMEIIEMGELFDDDRFIGENAGEVYHDRPYGSETAATHIEDESGEQVPLDCQQLNDQWSVLAGVDGLWLDADGPGPDAADRDLGKEHGSNEGGQFFDEDALSSGLFGSASVVNVLAGTLFSYDARAIENYDDEDGNLHFRPGTSDPNLNSGDNEHAYVYDGDGSTRQINYDRTIDAVSAVFMHDQTMNEYVLGGPTAAESEWVITFPTKGWYVDPAWAEKDGGFIYVNDGACPYEADHDNNVATPDLLGDWVVDPDGDGATGWVLLENGDYFDGDDEGSERDEFPIPAGCAVDTEDTFFGSDPFTSTFDGEACEEVGFGIWDANENASATPSPGDDLPIVSPPPPPGTSTPGVAFELCYETSVLKFGDSDIFGSRNTHTVNTTNESGWARIDFGLSDEDGLLHVLESDDEGSPEDMVGLPVTGFWAAKFVNGVLPGGVLANYGGLFDHKGSTQESFERQSD